MIGRAVISMSILVALCLSGPAADDLVDKYVKMWNKQREEIVSAHIKFKWCRASRDNVRALSPQQVKTLFETSHLEDDPAQFEILLDKLWKPGAGWRPLAKEGELWIEGNRFREELRAPDGSLAVTNVYDGENQITARPGNTTLVYNAGGSPVGSVRLDDFRDLPKFPEGATWVAERSRDGMVLMRHLPNQKFKGPGLLKVDEDSGRLIYSEGFSGEQFRYHQFQGRDRTFPGGISLPQYSAKVDYHSHPTATMSGFDVFYVLEAKLNSSIDAERFRVSLAQGGAVVDNRSNPPRSIVSSPVNSPDVIAALNEQAGLPPPPPIRAGPNYWTIAFSALAGLAIALVGYRVYRARRAG